jgi:hypothetical protein
VEWKIRGEDASTTELIKKKALTATSRSTVSRFHYYVILFGFCLFLLPPQTPFTLHTMPYSLPLLHSTHPSPSGIIVIISGMLGSPQGSLLSTNISPLS